MNRNSVDDALFEAPLPKAPSSRTPSIDTLQAEVIRRRKARKTARITIGVVSLGLLVLLMVRPSGTSPETSTTPPTTEPTAPSSLADAKTSGVSVGPQSQVSTAQRDAQPPQGVRVFATVQTPIPVFGVEEESRLYRHVGWIQSEEIVPVDVTQLPMDQQRSFEAVLQENTLPNFISL